MRLTFCSVWSAIGRRPRGGKAPELMRKELAWLRRGAPARTSKPKFRIDAANALIADVPPVRNTVELKQMAVSRLGKDVVDLENVSVTLKILAARW